MPKRNSKRKITLPAALVFCVVAVVFYLIQDQETETAPVSSYPEGCTMEVHFIDVGQGMATLIQHEGENLLIDTGDRSAKDELMAYLEEAVLPISLTSSAATLMKIMWQISMM